ncbi:MAG: acetyltransferase [Flavobacterium sp.]
MENIFLFGASDHCKYTIDIIEKEGKYKIVGIFDKRLLPGEIFYSYKVLGYIDDLLKLSNSLKISKGIVAIGDNFTRMKLANEIKSIIQDFKFVNAIHPSVIIGKNSKIGDGCVFMAGVILNNDCLIGDYVFLATKSSVDHDSIISNYSSLSPGVTTGGRVTIGECTAIGIGATILHYINIGSNCVIGASSLINKDVQDNSVIYGVPGKLIRIRLNDEKYL